MRRSRHHPRGFVSLSIIEAIVVTGMAVYLASWIIHPARNALVVRNSINLEMLQRDHYQRLDRVIEDIREATDGSFSWASLNPSDVSYNPMNFPWFVIQNPSIGGAPTYACYFFENGPGTFWRVTTRIPPTMTDPCNASTPGAVAKEVVSGLLTPTPGEPLFRGDFDSRVIYFTLRSPLGSTPASQAGVLPRILEVTRMAAARN